MVYYLLLLQEPENHVTLGKMVLEYVGFLSYFAVYGALGFHFQVLKSLRSESAIDIGGSTVDRADRRAGVIGLGGGLLMVFTTVAGLAQRAGEKHISMMAALNAGGGRLFFQMGCIALFVICFALAAQRMKIVWVIAGITAVAYALRNITTGRWFSMVNPLHEVAASLWLGTLMVLVFAGLVSVWRGSNSSDERGRLVTEMVSRFSPLALSAAGLLAVTGVTTAWRHLKHLNSLWTTPYGYTLDAKLCVVAIVVALGAWNWRRMAPQLGNESAAIAIRKSARTELSVAAVVLALTSLLVSLPSPKPGPPGAGPPPGAGSRPGAEATPGAGAPPAGAATKPGSGN
jgi:putative copper export protein